MGASDPPMIAADLQVAVITPDRLLTVPLALDNMAEFAKLWILLQSLPFPSADLLSILLSDRKGGNAYPFTFCHFIWNAFVPIASGSGGQLMYCSS